MVEDSAEIRERLMAEYPLKLLWLDRKVGDAVSIGSLKMDPGSRGQGLGTKVMQEIVDWADENGHILVLTPEADWDAKAREAQKRRLTKWYRTFGFVPNKGRRKDFRFRETMIRHPAGQANPSAVRRLTR